MDCGTFALHNSTFLATQGAFLYEDADVGHVYRGKLEDYVTGYDPAVYCVQSQYVCCMSSLDHYHCDEFALFLPLNGFIVSELCFVGDREFRSGNLIASSSEKIWRKQSHANERVSICFVPLFSCETVRDVCSTYQGMPRHFQAR